MLNRLPIVPFVGITKFVPKVAVVEVKASSFVTSTCKFMPALPLIVKAPPMVFQVVAAADSIDNNSVGNQVAITATHSAERVNLHPNNGT